VARALARDPDALYAPPAATSRGGPGRRRSPGRSATRTPRPLYPPIRSRSTLPQRPLTARGPAPRKCASTAAARSPWASKLNSARTAGRVSDRSSARPATRKWNMAGVTA
jgi:hypothetical protein